MKRLYLYIFLLSLLLAGCREAIPVISDTHNSNKIAYPPNMSLEGPAGVENQFDISGSPYYPQIDFYNMAPSGSLTILENFKTYQQTTELTCGPACIVMLLEYYGMNDGQSDQDLYEIRENKEKPETWLREMIDILKSLGKWEIYSTYDLENPEDLPIDFIINTLKEEKPIIVGDDEWGGHWRIIIGYDDMGDDSAANDVLILADPYDTTDHNQDGYTIVPFQRLYYNWSNRFDPDFTRNLFIVASPVE